MLKGSRFAALMATLALSLLLTGCQDENGSTSEGGDQPVASSGVQATGFAERAARRAYEGAPPVIPHQDHSQTCIECHGPQPIEVPSLGLSPASPHGETTGMGAARCRQCHVNQNDSGLFAKSTFAGLTLDPDATGADGIHGDRFNPLSPPRIPHRVFLRENCSACHTGVAARPEIRTTHPERVRCEQCHVERAEVGAFDSPLFSSLTATPTSR